MNEFEEMAKIPDEVLESIAGGKLTDRQREAVEDYANEYKSNNWSLDRVLSVYRDDFESPRWTEEDLQEIEEIIKSVYGA